MINIHKLQKIIKEEETLHKKDKTELLINSIIPLNIYQTCNTLNLSKQLKQNVEILKRQNPEFN